MREQVQKAIAAHGIWKQRLKSAIESGQSTYTVAGVAQDDQCEFGKWLYGSPGLNRSGSHFETVRQLHADFHKEVSAILAKALAGKRREALNDMGVGTRYGRISSQLTRELLQWNEKAA